MGIRLDKPLGHDDNDNVIIIVGRDDWDQFQEIINKMPAEPSEELKRLMASSAPWDKSE